ncbi:hypothetical protein [Acidithiobacillus sp. HP-11]
MVLQQLHNLSDEQTEYQIQYLLKPG